MFNPIIASSNIKQSFVDYISTSLSISDAYYREQFRKELTKEIGRGPYLDIGGSYKEGKSLRELIEDGIVTELFMSLEDVPESEKELKCERPLYSHQEEALCKARDGNNLVVTTGTGSGKTECFILPIIQSLLEEKKAGALTDAVRAIIIYPMNALANDQMERFRRILKNCGSITFGIYTGNTRHAQKEAERDYRNLHTNLPLPNEKISREAMQKNPPHILITNYSMLEYMMLRPKDDAVFSGANLRYIVLDEAHIYRGATGIEMAYLMRRLQARISNPDKARYILTSATLGNKKADDDIVAFADNLCGVKFSSENIIRSVEIRQKMIDSLEFPDKFFADLYADTRPISEILDEYNANFAEGKDDSEKLFEMLLRSELFAKLRSTVDKPKTVAQIAKEMSISVDELVHLIGVSAKAVKDGTSLIKARYHFFLRALEGAFVSLTGKRKLYLVRREHDEDENTVFECAICNDCGRLALAGRVEEHQLLHPKKGYDDETVEYFLIKQDKESEFLFGDDEDESEEDENDSHSSDEFDYTLCPICGAIDLERTAQNGNLCKHDSRKYVNLRKAKIRRSNKEAACPVCELGNFRRFSLGYEAATAVLGKALYEELPEYETKRVPGTTSEKTGQNFFGLSNKPKTIETPKIRQYLTFSDSRAGAAFFASYMEKSHQEFQRRRGLWQVCDDALKNKKYFLTTRETVRALSRLFEDNRSFVEIGKENETQADICLAQAYLAVINELASSRRSSGLVQLGRLAYVYSPKDADKLAKWETAITKTAELLPKSDNRIRDSKALLNLLILDIVNAGALDAGDDHTLNEEEREYLFYSPFPRKVTKVKKPKDKNSRIGWLPRQRTGKTKSYFYNTRMVRVKNALGFDDETAWQFLEQIWDTILDFREETDYSFAIQDFDIILCDTATGQENATFYRCEKCHRATVHNCLDRCISVKCTGKIEEFDSAPLHLNNHYVKLYSINKLEPFYIKEHTAQLSRDRGAEYQRLFAGDENGKNKKVNALSCSTTFEMGVDVGTLETVFLRNIPPTPANYIQRAGRAGRRLQSAAYALTYAKLSSHDLSFFQQPERMISGLIKAPRFKLENEKIARRHINAIAISAFLGEYPEYYDGDNQSNFLNSGGYEKLKEYIDAKPSYLSKLLHKSIPDDYDYGIDDWSWRDFFIGEKGILEIAIQSYRDTVKYLESELKKASKDKNFSLAVSIERKLRSFRADKEKDKFNDGKSPRKSLIDFFVRNNVLPKYGFPVDTVELYPDPISARDANRPQMQRDLQLAVAEYAPGSEIVADGRLYTSRYIHKTLGAQSSNWEYGWYAKCHNRECLAENYYGDSTIRSDMTCLSCGEKIKKPFWHKTLEPRKGFVAEDNPKPVKMSKPETTYRTEDIYIGDPNRRIIDKRTFSSDGNIIIVESTTNDSLVVRTQTQFKVCEFCGYATGKGEAYDSNHKTSYGKVCNNNNEGREYYLTHEFKTDVARITFVTDAATDYGCMLSVLFAMLEAMSGVLDIERNDIKGCLFRAKTDRGLMLYNLIIYDSVAGGAGHSRRLLTKDGEVLSNVINRAVKLMDSCACEPSCYNCLRNYYNQKIHEYLDRAKAANFLRCYTSPMAYIEDSSSEYVNTAIPQIIIIDKTPLRDDYEDWNDAAVLFDGYEGIVNQFIDREITLADSFEASLQVNDSTVNAYWLWENKKIAICEYINQTDLDILENAGWYVMCTDNFSIDQLIEWHGGV